MQQVVCVGGSFGGCFGRVIAEQLTSSASPLGLRESASGPRCQQLRQSQERAGTSGAGPFAALHRAGSFRTATAETLSPLAAQQHSCAQGSDSMAWYSRRSVARRHGAAAAAALATVACLLLSPQSAHCRATRRLSELEELIETSAAPSLQHTLLLPAWPLLH